MGKLGSNVDSGIQTGIMLHDSQYCPAKMWGYIYADKGGRTFGESAKFFFRMSSPSLSDTYKSGFFLDKRLKESVCASSKPQSLILEKMLAVFKI